MKAVLFDYNGTLIDDDDINEEAWLATIAELSKGTLDARKLYIEYTGMRNVSFVEVLFDKLGLPRDEEQIMYWARRKETEYYHKISRQKKRDQLKPGAVELLDHLKERQFPINMCTASLDVNVDFYFEYLKLDRWFDRDLVVYDDGISADKKDMYIEGARRLGVSVIDCLIFDDSPSSIRKAVEAGCENLVVIRRENNPDLPQVRQRINDFSEFDRRLLDI